MRGDVSLRMSAASGHILPNLGVSSPGMQFAGVWLTPMSFPFLPLRLLLSTDSSSIAAFPLLLSAPQTADLGRHE